MAKLIIYNLVALGIFLILKAIVLALKEGKDQVKLIPKSGV